jgi:hypothetical protein
MTRDAARVDEWLKDVAPSTPLRRWYGHRPELFTEFRCRYQPCPLVLTRQPSAPDDVHVDIAGSRCIR